MNTLIAKVEKIGETVSEAFNIMATKRGRDQVWRIVGGCAWGVALVILGWVLTVSADKRNEAMISKQAAIAAEVAKQLKVSQSETKRELEQIKSATMPSESQK